MCSEWATRHNLSAQQFQEEFNLLKGQGYRPVDVNGTAVNDTATYSGIWEKSPGPDYEVRHGITGTAHQQLVDSLLGQGFRPIAVSAHSTASGPRFTSLWLKKPGPAVVIRHGLTAAQWQDQVNSLPGQGFRPVDVCGYNDGNQVRFTSVWEKSDTPPWIVRHGLTESQYQQHFDHEDAHGFRIMRVTGYLDNGQTRYVALWSKEAAMTLQARHRLNAAQHQAAFVDLERRGYRPVKVSGYPENGTVHYASIWHKPFLSGREVDAIRDIVNGFRTAHAVPGVSVAVSRRGGLMFAQGYGTADNAGRQVTPNMLFRIASVSKPITAIAVFRAIEEGSLALGSRVFGPNGILGTAYGSPPYPDTRVNQITVQHLLEHTSGWSTAQDPMFNQPTASQADLIGQMLATTLANNPGSVHDYLNFGYCVLGRVLERISGLTYAQYVRTRVLNPAGVSDMHIAGDTLAQRRSNEVMYTQQGLFDPYKLPVARMDAHGGWIANAMDLLRITHRADGFFSVKDILQPATITTMSTPTTAPKPNGDPAGYAKGWAVSPDGNWFHLGDFTGMMTILVRTNDQFCWAILANTRDDPDIEAMKKAIDQLGWTIKNSVTEWPVAEPL